MYVRFTTSKKSKHPTLQIVEGFREGKKVKQKIIASFGVIRNTEDKKKLVMLAENFIQKLQKEGFPIETRVLVKDILHKRTIYNGFSLVVDQLMKISGFSFVIQQAQGKKNYDLEEIVKLIISQRLAMPSSKLRTFERQQEQGFEGIELHNFYRAMDAIEPLEGIIQKKAFDSVCAYSDTPVDCFFFDVTTLYFESVTQDEVKNFGFSKDQKYHLVQVVLALVVNSAGVPLAYETFEGNIAETKTLIPVLESLRARFSIKNVTVICDRGLASQNNVQALKDARFSYVIATKLRSIAKKNKINDLAQYKPLPHQEDVLEKDKVLYRTMDHPQYSDTTLIVTYSPSRAVKDQKDRERLLEKLKEKLSEASENTAVKKVISNGGYKKFTTIEKGTLIKLNEKAIEEDAAWDGFHGIAVSKNANLSFSDALTRYRDLWRIEETFRIAKSTLKARPIFHWKPRRIRSHILLCFMTLFLERLLELLLRKNNVSLTPDQIRYALAKVHTIFFEESSSRQQGQMESRISEDAEKIFKTLNIPTQNMVKAN